MFASVPAPMLLSRIGGLVQQVPVKTPQGSAGRPRTGEASGESQRMCMPLPSPHKLPVGFSKTLDMDNLEPAFLSDTPAGLTNSPESDMANDQLHERATPQSAVKRGLIRLSRQNTCSTSDSTWESGLSHQGSPIDVGAEPTLLSASGLGLICPAVPPLPWTQEIVPLPVDASEKQNGSLRERLYKTKMCSFYEAGKCRFNALCKFAHCKDELQPTPDFSRTRPCPTQARLGFCSDLDCRFAHSSDEWRDLDLEVWVFPTQHGTAEDAATGDVVDDSVETMMPFLSVKHTFITFEDEQVEQRGCRSQSAPAPGELKYLDLDDCSPARQAAQYAMVSPSGTRKMPFRRHVATRGTIAAMEHGLVAVEPRQPRQRARTRPLPQPLELPDEPQRRVSSAPSRMIGDPPEQLQQVTTPDEMARHKRARGGRTKTMPEAALVRATQRLGGC